MGRLFIVSIAAMTSFMTMVQLIALTLTLPTSTTPQAKAGPEKMEVASAKSLAKKNEEVASRKSATHHTRHHRAHIAPRSQRIAPDKVDRLLANKGLSARNVTPARMGVLCYVSPKPLRTKQLLTGERTLITKLTKRGWTSRTFILEAKPQ
jgi:hypothetical protein